MMAIVAILIKGGPVMIPLLLCSVLAVAVVLERAWFWWRLDPRHDTERVLELAAAGKWEDAARVGDASPTPGARVLAAGIQDRTVSAALAMEAAAQTEAARMKRGLVVLDTIITLAPLLGLLGTVTGMIGSFGVMAESGINQPHAITGGVAEALIATAAGLVVAIAALVPYNAFNARVEATLDRIDRDGTRLQLLVARAGGERSTEATP
jgi:biopolymer transport protein ExbB